jgi:DNA-binding Xre family transcriptional regulator
MDDSLVWVRGLIADKKVQKSQIAQIVGITRTTLDNWLKDDALATGYLERILEAVDTLLNGSKIISKALNNRVDSDLFMYAELVSIKDMYYLPVPDALVQLHGLVGKLQVFSTNEGLFIRPLIKSRTDDWRSILISALNTGKATREDIESIIASLK